MMQRRSFLTAMAAFAALPRVGFAQAEATPFSVDALYDMAQGLAQSAYEPMPEVPQAWKDLSYDEYRKMWFRGADAIWRGTDSPFQIELFHPGLYFPRPVKISLVEDGQAQELKFDFSLFDKSDDLPDLPIDDTLGYSGFRLTTEFRRPGNFEEFFVMQGASYFRAIARGQNYGQSARGLAIGTASDQGEEFPDFTHFWIERPPTGRQEITIHALLNSPSVAGIYSFDIIPGSPTIMDVRAQIYPRVELTRFGLGPLTSMFLFDETNRSMFDDFRPAVHDTDGLLVRNGNGETLWRPLANPKSLQVSSFVDQDPKGFGLMQRARDLADFADLEAHYHIRPGLWVEPGEDWGAGAVTLVEIPADREIYDNIVAYWQPREALIPCSMHRFTYRLSWGEDPTLQNPVARVLNTRMGERFGGGRIVAIDFEDSTDLPEDLGDLTLHVSTNTGEVTPAIIQRNPQTGGVRMAFTFHAGEATAAELRAQILLEGRSISEVWLYRWTA